MQSKEQDSYPRQMLEIVAGAKPSEISEATWTEVHTVLRWYLSLGIRVGFTVEEAYGLTNGVLVKTAYEAAPTSMRDRIRRVWPRVVRVLHSQFDLAVPEPDYGERGGRPPYYTPELFDAVRTMQAVGVNPTRLCKLRWGDVRYDAESNQLLVRSGQFSENGYEVNDALRDAWETIRKWSAGIHHRAPDKLLPEYFVIPHSKSVRLPASPTAFYTAMKRHSGFSDRPDHHTGRYSDSENKPKTFSWGEPREFPKGRPVGGES